MACSVKFAGDDSGAIAILSAVFMFVGIALAALAIDLGALHVERREAQGASDLAAIAASRDLDHAEAAARATLEANNILRITKLTVERGAYVADPALKANLRFTAGKTPFNAARVTVEKNGALYFGHALHNGPMPMSVTSMAATTGVAAFSIGSRLAAVRDGVANNLLSALLGGSVALSVADYNALLSADIDLFKFMDALATNVGVSAGTYNDVLQSSATVGNVLAAAASAADANGNATAKAAIDKLARQSNSKSLTVPLSKYLSLGGLGGLAVGTPAPGLDATFKAMDLISGAATLANGEHQATVDLGAAVPGLLSLKADITVGEPPQSSAWAAVGEVGSTARTAQIRVRLVAEVGGAGALLGLKVRLPIYLDVAYAEGRLAKITCSASNSGSVDIAARSGVADLWIGEVSTAAISNFNGAAAVAEAQMVEAPLIKIKGRAHVAAGSTTETTLSFSASDIANGAIKRVKSTGLTQSIVASLIGDLKLTVQVLGLGLQLPSVITAAVGATLAPVTAPLDQVVDTLLETLGVSIGEADVRVHGVRCGAGMLAG